MTTPRHGPPTAADWLARAAAVEPAQRGVHRRPVRAGRLGRDVRRHRRPRRLAHHRVAEGGVEDVDRAVGRRATAFDDRRWADQSPADRKRVLLRLAELIRANREELALLESLDVGKPIRDTLAVDVPSAAKTIQWFAETIDKVYGEVGPTGPDALSLVTREPIGVVAAIVPWNYPLIITAWKLGAALATGNTVVLKPASQSPLTALRLAELAAEAGLPDGVLNVVPGPGPSIGTALARHPGVDKIAFTGSTEVGKSLLRAVGESDVKAITLELGGKSPQVVLADVGDLEAAAPPSAGGSSTTAARPATPARGSSSTARVREELVERIAAFGGSSRRASRSTRPPGSARSSTTASCEKVLGYVELGREEGARVVAGGERVREESGGFFVEPTILDGVDNAMARRPRGDLRAGPDRDRVRGRGRRAGHRERHAVRAGRRDLDARRQRAHRLARAIRAGVVWVNTFDAADITVPFGGFKQSGFGRDKGMAALDGYTQLKTTWIDLSGCDGTGKGPWPVRAQRRSLVAPKRAGNRFLSTAGGLVYMANRKSTGAGGRHKVAAGLEPTQAEIDAWVARERDDARPG